MILPVTQGSRRGPLAGRRRPASAVFLISALAASLLALAPVSEALARTRKHVPKVLLVGEYHGKKGKYSSIQEARTRPRKVTGS